MHREIKKSVYRLAEFCFRLFLLSDERISVGVTCEEPEETIMKVPAKPFLAGMALASMLLAGARLASATGSECAVDDWNDALASSYCSSS